MQDIFVGINQYLTINKSLTNKKLVMKKLAITLTTVVLFFATSAFTNKSDDVPGKVKNSFEKDFSNALNVTWEKNDNLYFANFSWNSSDVKAVFNADGDLLSTSRKVNIAELPLKISMALEKKYKGYKIEDNAIELISDDQTVYHFAISNDKEEIKLTSDANGNIETASN
jgi:hypothetical protein